MINKENYRRGSTSNDEGEAEPWLITYADLFTLLFAFFVLLVNSSDHNPEKFEDMKASFEKVIDKESKSALAQERINREKLKEQIESYIKEEKLEEQIKLEENERGLKIEFPSNGFFASGSANMAKDSEKIMAEILAIFETVDYKTFKISTEGHTDDVPIKTARFTSNWELSSSRAASVADYLTENGIGEDRVKVAGFGDTRPVVPVLETMSDDEKRAARSKNRRIAVQLIYFKEHF